MESTYRLHTSGHVTHPQKNRLQWSSGDCAKGTLSEGRRIGQILDTRSLEVATISERQVRVHIKNSWCQSRISSTEARCGTTGNFSQETARGCIVTISLNRS